MTMSIEKAREILSQPPRSAFYYSDMLDRQNAEHMVEGWEARGRHERLKHEQTDLADPVYLEDELAYIQEQNLALAHVIDHLRQVIKTTGMNRNRTDQPRSSGVSVPIRSTSKSRGLQGVR